MINRCCHSNVLEGSDMYTSIAFFSIELIKIGVWDSTSKVVLRGFELRRCPIDSNMFAIKYAHTFVMPEIRVSYDAKVYIHCYRP